MHGFPSHEVYNVEIWCFLVVNMNKLLIIGDVMTIMGRHYCDYGERSDTVAKFVSVNQRLSLIYYGNAHSYNSLHGHKIDGLVQGRRNSIAIALELRLSCTKLYKCHPHGHTRTTRMEQAPVPLSIFRSNSKFDENSECSSFEYTRPITTIFCTRHDSDTVVTCAKYRCDRPRILYTRVFWIFIEFRIRSKYA